MLDQSLSERIIRLGPQLILWKCKIGYHQIFALKLKNSVQWKSLMPRLNEDGDRCCKVQEVFHFSLTKTVICQDQYQFCQIPQTERQDDKQSLDLVG